MTFDYYYGQEAETYSFYRIPKVLFTDPRFSPLSCEAKVLYGLMLDRMGLSMKNGWMDKQNRVFIYFTLEEVQASMGCAHGKGVRLLAELDTQKGIGLIERVKQGLGKPTVIYVKNCIGRREVQTSENGNSGDGKTSDFEKSVDAQTSDSGNSGLPATGSADLPKPAGNKTELSKPDFSEPDPSIYPADRMDSMGADPAAGTEGAIAAYREIVHDNISVELLIEQHGKDQVEEIAELILDILCASRKSIRIGGEDMPASVVKGRFMKLDYTHVEYVLNALAANTTKIRNIRAYLLKALYTAPTTITSYYQAEVNHDLHGGGS